MSENGYGIFITVRKFVKGKKTTTKNPGDMLLKTL